ncbi:MAG: hypothetical protein IKI50_00615 [Clostridia bacterium]|nr:hypothetical protein [Clostridia bacterium]
MIWRETLLCFLTAALLQNIVLSTGFGASMLLRTLHRSRDTLVFSLLLMLFAVSTVLLAYPIDMALGTSWNIKLLRPGIVVAITAVLYGLFSLLFRHLLPRFYTRYGRFFPLAAFNNLVIAVALIINHRAAVTLLPAVGIALGACAGFLFLSLCTRECVDRTDHPDMPYAFRGMPVSLLYLGILALGFMGFASSYSI